jgi:DNA-binding protein Fis
MEPAAPAASDDVTPLWGKFISERLQRGCTHLYDESLELMERHLITEVLRHTGGNQLRAAATLGITRGCLRNKIRSLGITLECSVSAG